MPWGASYRAYKTLPAGMRLDKSLQQGAGLGIFSDVFLRAHTLLGEYEGETWILPENQVPRKGAYTWQVSMGQSLVHSAK